MSFEAPLKCFEAVQELIKFAGDDPLREGLIGTPKRVLKAYGELFSGYEWTDADIEEMLTTFDGEKHDEMVILKEIEFASTCEHHMLPFLGVAHVAYIPNDRIVGISKLARLVEVYSRRLQIQERICQQVTTALMEHLKPKGAACVLEAKHLCISCRGVGKQHSMMVTSSMEGCFGYGKGAEDPNDTGWNVMVMNTRQEFLRLIGK